MQALPDRVLRENAVCAIAHKYEDGDAEKPIQGYVDSRAVGRCICRLEAKRHRFRQRTIDMRRFRHPNRTPHCPPFRCRIRGRTTTLRALFRGRQGQVDAGCVLVHDAKRRFDPRIEQALTL